MKKTILLATLFSLATVSIVSASNQILLKSGHFTPPEGITTFTKLSIEAIPERAHVLIQLTKIPTNKERKELEAKGIKLLSYVPDKAWFATIPSDKTSEIAALPEVRSICDIWAEDKVSPQIIDRGVAGHATNDDGTVNLTVQFFKDISLDDAAILITNYGGSIVGKARIINALDITIAEDLLPELANEDIVQWIDEFPPPPVLLNDGSRAAIGVDYVQASPYDLNGVDVIVGQWDGGCVDMDHNDLKKWNSDIKRVTHRDCDGLYPFHATHVAGTMIGNGYWSQLGGEPGYDCTTCFAIDPKYVKVVFYGIERNMEPCAHCVEYYPPPPNWKEFILPQDGSPGHTCEWQESFFRPGGGLYSDGYWYVDYFADYGGDTHLRLFWEDMWGEWGTRLRYSYAGQAGIGVLGGNSNKQQNFLKSCKKLQKVALS